MELNISEYDNQSHTDFDYFDDQDLEQEQFQSSFEKIPENIKPAKKVVRIQNVEPVKPMNQTIPKVNARMVRPQIPNPKPKISYEDILSNMGMFVANGKLHLVENNSKQQQPNNQQQSFKQQPFKQSYNQQEPLKQSYNQNIPQNSYIYNKYFQDELKPQNTVNRPMTANEYKQKLIMDILQKQRIKQIKSTKLIMPNTNINISSNNSGNLNKLFHFSKR
jgi:hypothetical protein